MPARQAVRIQPDPVARMARSHGEVVGRSGPCWFIAVSAVWTYCGPEAAHQGVTS